MSTGFIPFGLSDHTLKTLSRLEFNEPTPIQAETLPHALQGKDILGSAQTGTGKTAAFGIPLVEHLEKNPEQGALVIAPTRELAQQVFKQLMSFLGRRYQRQSALLIGGESIYKQFTQLRRQPRLIVGTPGRINDHLNRETLTLGHVNYLVLDEMDRMLDMGFAEQIADIIECIDKTRQTLLFSATIPKAIERASANYLTDPVKIAIGSTSRPAEHIKHDILQVDPKQKYPALLQELEAREGSIIVFVKTKAGADKMAAQLRYKDIEAEAIHGDLHQRKRERVIRSYRQGRFRVLVATDVAARGLDIPHVRHVINYDLPQCPEDYIHRIGRTARNGATGEAICFLCHSDKRQWYFIERLLDPEKARKPQGKSSRPFGGNRSGKPSHAKGKRPFGNRRNGEGEGEGRRFGRSRDNEQEGRRGFGKRRDGEQEGRSFGKRRDGDSSRGGFGKRRDGENENRSFGKRRDGDNPRGGFGGRRRDGEGRKSFGGQGRRQDGQRGSKPAASQRQAGGIRTWQPSSND